ncbi:toxin YdaT family protein [Salmonella enterica]|uniref:toxin YdaT family protein n=1 Tax=Salmonella enterica TaxID=28901 RepID=UPI0018D1EF16|nr:toxin YdaT family protein [Salmonella enterica]MBH0365749.1 hypothetical protein [Salmonella enterica]MBH0484097.1 hypothetical protein [Salmonella enterica]MBH5273512.1 hypothetical protein [Salmonella enterica]MBH5281949.1 hypothetical protein [Salmonella enterica]MDO3888177.1 toxin YdaT family protein [Salmonella enterica]
MKISPSVEAVAAELELWALAVGWKTVGALVAGEYHACGGGQLLPIPDNSDGLRNAVQRLQRVFRGFDGPRYSLEAEALKPFVLAAMPAETRVRLESPGDPVLLAALAAKEGIEAVNAVNLGAAPASIIKELEEAISAFVATKNAIQRNWKKYEVGMYG